MIYKNRPKTKMYRGYNILNKADIEDNLDSMITVLTRAKEEMIKPLMFHFIIGMTNPDKVPSKLVQAIKTKFVSEVNKDHKKRKANGSRGRNTPKVELIFSIETKPIKNTDKLHDHIHIMFIADAGHNAYGSKELSILINKALNRVDGFEKLIFQNDFNIFKAVDGFEFGEGFLKYRYKATTICADDNFHDIRCHDLKNEFKDAIVRASYLCKSEQKKQLPERYAGSKNQSFGTTRKARAVNKIKEVA